MSDIIARAAARPSLVTTVGITDSTAVLKDKTHAAVTNAINAGALGLSSTHPVDPVAMSTTTYNVSVTIRQALQLGDRFEVIFPAETEFADDSSDSTKSSIATTLVDTEVIGVRFDSQPCVRYPHPTTPRIVCKVINVGASVLFPGDPTTTQSTVAVPGYVLQFGISIIITMPHPPRAARSTITVVHRDRFTDVNVDGQERDRTDSTLFNTTSLPVVVATPNTHQCHHQLCRQRQDPSCCSCRQLARIRPHPGLVRASYVWHRCWVWCCFAVHLQWLRLFGQVLLQL